VVTFEQFCFASGIRMQKHNYTTTDQESYAINRSSRHNSDERVGMPQLIGFESEPR
jgi:hypothetical protein